MRNIHRALGALSATTLLLLPLACGDDDGDGSTAEDATTTTTTTSADTDTGTSEDGADGSAFPSEEFCDAVADFESAQDGAERNQALGDMVDAAGDDVPQAITDAIEDLDTGDLPPEAYEAAGKVLSAVCD